jgi:hypothetical protein
MYHISERFTSESECHSFLNSRYHNLCKLEMTSYSTTHGKGYTFKYISHVTLVRLHSRQISVLLPSEIRSRNRRKYRMQGDGSVSLFKSYSDPNPLRQNLCLICRSELWESREVGIFRKQAGCVRTAAPFLPACRRSSARYPK